MTVCSPVLLPGALLHPDPSGALYWPDEATLVVADLHFEKGSAFAARGVLLPPYDTRATLARLRDACRRYRPRRVIALGDSFHDRNAAERLSSEDSAALSALVNAHDWIWIAGNHDPMPPKSLGGAVVSAARIGPLVFRHVPSAGGAHDFLGELSGHLHPCASITVRGRRFRRRCFASDARRVILPAFGAFTGGLDLEDEAFDGLFGGPLTAWLLGERGAYPVRVRRPVSSSERTELTCQ